MNELEKIEEKFNNYIFNRLYEKYLIAIRDLNHIMKLESLADIDTKKSLESLREYCANNNYYINKNYLQNNKDYIIYIILKKIKEMPNEIKEEINDEYPNVIDYIIQTNIKQESIQNIDPIIIKKVNRWWN